MKRSLVLKGRIPSKKNSKKIVCRGRFPMVLPSSAYEAWQEEMMWELKSQDSSRVDNISKIEILFYAPDKRKADKTNKAESIMDLLVDVGIIEDDNWFVFPELVLKFGGVDRESPRAEIVIDYEKSID